MSAYKWAILLLVTVTLLASACTMASAQSTQGGVVKISSPPRNGKAGPTERVSGKAQLSKGYSLWIVPYDPTAGKYYPEAPLLTVRSDANWSSRLSVGTIFGVGKTFQIYAVVADKSASASAEQVRRAANGNNKTAARCAGRRCRHRKARGSRRYGRAICKPLAQRRAAHGVNRWIERDCTGEYFYGKRRSSECSCK